MPRQANIGSNDLRSNPVAAAEGHSAAEPAQDCHYQPTRPGEPHRVGTPPFPDHKPVVALGPQQHAAEQPAEQAAADACRQHRNNDVEFDLLNVQVAEIVVIALQGDGDHPRQNNRAEQDTAGAGFELASQLLNCEGDAGQRRIERSSDTGGAAGQDQVFAADDAGIGQVAMEEVHDRRRHLHGRPFAPGRKTAGQRQCTEAYLGEGDAQGHQLADVLPLVGQAGGGDDLGNAAALGTGKKARGQPHHQHAHQRCIEKGQPRMGAGLLGELSERHVSQARKHHHHQPGDGGAGPQGDPGAPAQ
ncbi:hypothetical protein ALP97_200133 [Pseudomonas salomonii]|uniref:Uncharacterized protein n=1 Tax=Pseudomonas salomonii TaxID=191391 RepID=A0A3M4QE59_9PSED|nr:hypothetical protein ALP97_200133 [Pseudomonas salomonii]